MHTAAEQTVASPSPTPTILYTLPDGHQVAALLRTALFRSLTADARYRWVFLSPLADRAEFRQQFDHPRVAVRLLPRVVPGVLDRHIEFVRRELVNQRLDPTFTRVVYRRLRGSEPKRWLVHRPLARLLGRIPAIDDWLYRLQDRLGRDRALEAALDEIGPQAVVLGSGAVKMIDAAIARWARRRGLPTYGIIPSWDNLAMKGPTVRSDHIAVWSRSMADQAEELYGYRPEQVTITGPPQFDVYARNPHPNPFPRGEGARSNPHPSPLPRGEGVSLLNGEGMRARRDRFLKGLRLDPGRRLITFTTIPPFNADFSPLFVEQAAAWIRDDAFGEPCQLLVRLHPQDDPKLYERCKGLPHVRLDSPGRFRASAPFTQAIVYYDPTEADVGHLRDTLLFSDVVMNIASTITLEAVALDRPVVNLAYNPAGSRWPVSIREYYALPHYRPVTTSGAVRLAVSPQELLEALREGLRFPERRRGERAQLFQRIVTYTDGRCALRLADDLLAFLDRRLASLSPRQSDPVRTDYRAAG
jgi:hypothetical protein